MTTAGREAKPQPALGSVDTGSAYPSLTAIVVQRPSLFHDPVDLKSVGGGSTRRTTTTPTSRYHAGPWSLKNLLNDPFPLARIIISTLAGLTAHDYHAAIKGKIDAHRDLPPHPARSGYTTDLNESYPFHPELLLGLNEKVSTIPNLQKTRGALRLLARVVRGLWAKSPPGTWMIHPHHVDLADDEVAAEMGCVVASVEYRLAPEHPHPAPVEDCYTGLK